MSCLTISSRTGRHFPRRSVTPSWEFVVAPAGYSFTANTAPLCPAYAISIVTAYGIKLKNNKFNSKKKKRERRSKWHSFIFCKIIFWTLNVNETASKEILQKGINGKLLIVKKMKEKRIGAIKRTKTVRKILFILSKPNNSIPLSCQPRQAQQVPKINFHECTLPVLHYRNLSASD